MSEKTSDPKDEPSSEKEPFFLSILPFAGLGFLVLLAVFWQYLPEREEIPTTEKEVADLVIRRWEREPVRQIPVDTGRDYIHGPEDAPITLVEFSDFQCPFCRDATVVTREVLERRAGDVRVVFKNLPLDVACNEYLRQPLHPFACESAVLARCAGEQKEELFWSAHDALFAVPRLSREAVDAIPGNLPVSQEELSECMSAGEALSEVKEDIAVASELGVTSTPTFFLNGRRVSDYRFGALDALVEHVLEKGDESD